MNMFDEFSMIDPGPLACYVGFTEEEVKGLCEQYQMDMGEVKSWYDGYSFEKNVIHLQSAVGGKLYASWKNRKLLESDGNI